MRSASSRTRRGRRTGRCRTSGSSSSETACSSSRSRAPSTTRIPTSRRGGSRRSARTSCRGRAARSWHASSTSGSKLKERGVSELPEDELDRLVRNRNVLAALLEAALGALLLEHGFEPIETAVVAAFAGRIDYALTSFVDHKTELQEALAREGRSVKYEIVETEGPPHDRRFTCAARVDGEQLGDRQRRLEEGGRAGGRQAGPRRARADARELLARSPADSGRLRPRRRASTGLLRTKGAAFRPGPAIAWARVHLRAIKLRGFKSFPEPVEIQLEPGVAVVVGPNGSGKSNVADAIVWASGSLAPHELQRREARRRPLRRVAGRASRRSTARSSSCSTTGPATGRSNGRRSRSRGGFTAAARASTSSTRRRSAGSTSSSSSPTSGSAAGCTRSSARARSRRSSGRRHRSGACCWRRRRGSASSRRGGIAPS